MWPWLCWLTAAVAIIVSSEAGGADVTYDRRSLIINGQRKILFSGSIHYPRSTPDMWPTLIAKAKEGGLDVIETYVFWNLHEPKPGQYDFNGRYDLVRFIKEIQAQGLYAALRIGPFIEAEWNYGGFPFWLHNVPGIVYRSDNDPFKFYMQNFTTKIVNLMKLEGLYASQGGPIILSQIENEYQTIEPAFGEKGPSYVLWAAKMAVDLQTGVPWVMCKQKDAPNPVINACNGMKCGQTFEGPNSPNKPSLWTENWTSFIQRWGTEPYIRSPEDIAFHTALFVAARNGSYVNYYMYHGGTNFGRTAGAQFITSYYDQAPLDEYGLLRQPKWGHLKDLHTAVNLCALPLLQGSQTNFSIGRLQQAYVFEEKSRQCAAFLVNYETMNTTVQFRNMSFQLLPKSISILPDCRNVAFNTAKVNAMYNNERVTTLDESLNSTERWEEFKEIIPNYLDTSVRANALLEQTNVTQDESDYLWYTFRFQPELNCTEPTLHVFSLAHLAHTFVNDVYMGMSHGGRNFTVEYPIQLSNNSNNISILSAMVGLPDSGAFLERRFGGLRKVYIQCSQNSSYDITDYGYQVGFLGERLGIYNEQSTSNVTWNNLTNSTNQTLTWYKTKFNAPPGKDPVVLNLSSMGKGEAWVNGQSIGRFWLSFLTPQGNPSQTLNIDSNAQRLNGTALKNYVLTLYHVPRSFLKPCGNLLVLFEEAGGNPLNISLNTISITNLQGNISSYI